MEDLCVSQPCQNEGTCNLSNDGYKCLCPTGLKGTNCEEGKSNSSDGIFTERLIDICVGDAVVKRLVRLTTDQVVHIRAVAGDIVSCS